MRQLYLEKGPRLGMMEGLQALEEVTPIILLHKEVDQGLDLPHRVLLEGDQVQPLAHLEVRILIIRSVEEEEMTTVEVIIHSQEIMVGEGHHEILSAVQMEGVQETLFPLQETKIRVPTTHFPKLAHHLTIHFQKQGIHLQTTLSVVRVRTEILFHQAVLQAQILLNHHHQASKVLQTHSQEQQLLHPQTLFQVVLPQQL